MIPYFAISDELCLDLNHGHFCTANVDQLVEGQAVVTNFGIEPMVPSFRIIVDAHGSAKNEPHCRGLGLAVDPSGLYVFK